MAGLHKVKTSTLLQVAAGVFVTGATGLYLAQKFMQHKVRKLPHYSEGLAIVAEHAKAKDALGPPIQVGAVDLADRRRNYVDKTTAMLRIPVTGKFDAGYVEVFATRPSSTDQFHTAKVRLELSNGSIIIFDNGEFPLKTSSSNLESD